MEQYMTAGLISLYLIIGYVLAELAYKRYGHLWKKSPQASYIITILLWLPMWAFLIGKVLFGPAKKRAD